MFGTFLGMFRKRRRIDNESEIIQQSQSHDAPVLNVTQSHTSDSDLLKISRQLTSVDSDKQFLYRKCISFSTKLDQQNWPSSSKLVAQNTRNSQAQTRAGGEAIATFYERPDGTTYRNVEMEVDSSAVPPPQEYSDSPFQSQHSESSMNFDYLSGLHPNVASGSQLTCGMDPTSTAACDYAYVDERATDRPFDLNERFVSVLDQLDARVEKFRRDALGLQEKRDYLLMSIDLIKTNDLFHGMSDSEREEITCYIQRVNARLATVELNVRTIRDPTQEDSLSQINMLIDMMITLGDPVLSRQKCQQYLNACSSSDANSLGSLNEQGHGCEIDKKFESALLGCTLDDQKIIKKRLQALLGYLNKQTIHD